MAPHTSSGKNVARFQLSPESYILIRSQISENGVSSHPNYSTPHVSLHKERYIQMANKDGSMKEVLKHYAIHFTPAEYTSLLMSMECVNTTLRYLETRAVFINMTTGDGTGPTSSSTS